MNDCIAAICTPPGRGGVAIVRISGDGALELGRKMFSPLPDTLEPNFMYSGKADCGSFSDFGYFVYFARPRSFTGEDTVEFHCHGGAEIAKGILSRAISLGCSPAERGEFTRRAFLNGKMSLSSAEGMADMINAESEALARAGESMYFETLTNEVRAIQEEVKTATARVEVDMDYPEERVDEDFDDAKKSLADALSKIDSLLSTYSCGKRIKEGVTVAICGKPNVGKSSLLNALVGWDRAIVSSEAGTTRDTLEGAAEIEGVSFLFVDTAGLRDAAGEVERSGIERARTAIASADIVLSLSEDGNYLDLGRDDAVKVFTKSDLNEPCGDRDIAVSAVTGDGVEDLKKLIFSKSFGSAPEGLYVIEERHRDALARARDSLFEGVQGFETLPLDVVAVSLRDAYSALGEITGETANEDIVNEIFDKFCVGK